MDTLYFLTLEWSRGDNRLCLRIRKCPTFLCRVHQTYANLLREHVNFSQFTILPLSYL